MPLKSLPKILFPVVALALLVASTAAQRGDERPGFMSVLSRKLAGAPRLVVDAKGNTVVRTGIPVSDICRPDDPVEGRLLREYGAMFVGGSDVFAGFTSFRRGEAMVLAVRCMFASPAEADAYQQALRGSGGTRAETVGGVRIELQNSAMDAFLRAVSQAAALKLRISPRGGPIAARRSFEDTRRLWDSRFLPGLTHWVGRGRISAAAAAAARRLDIPAQVARVLAWEGEGLWFSKDLSKSILYSVAAPGASQHIFMVALDVEQFADPAVRKILAQHGWFQTVLSDLPHFTYLGVPEDRLPSLGLEPKLSGGQQFWIPKF